MSREKNTTTRTQIFHHQKYGALMRKPQGNFFRSMTGRDYDFIKKYTIMHPDEVDEDLINTGRERNGGAKILCHGCGKMFRKTEMDGTLCRGYDGCSIRAEIKTITVYNTIPFGGIGDGV